MKSAGRAAEAGRAAIARSTEAQPGADGGVHEVHAESVGAESIADADTNPLGSATDYAANGATTDISTDWSLKQPYNFI